MAEPEIQKYELLVFVSIESTSAHAATTYVEHLLHGRPGIAWVSAEVAPEAEK